MKLWFVAAPGGARGDFVAGWLGLLPGFLDNQWHIDLETGLSIGDMGRLRAIDHGQSLDQCLQEHQLELCHQADIIWSVALHGYKLQLKDFQQHIKNKSIQFLSIETDQADHDKIRWEFFIKTYLSTRRSLSWVQRKKSWVIDDSPTQDIVSNHDRIEKIKTLIGGRQQNCLSTRSLSKDVPAISLQYTKLFERNGSRYLCDQLELSCSDHYHDYWNDMLPKADSPDTVTVWKQEWSKQNLLGV